MRGRNRKGPNPMSRSYESNGPDVKVRGTAAHIAEKYVQLARDAQSSGDPVSAESYFQYAEHYYRILAAAQSQVQPLQGFSRSDDDREDFDGEGDGDEDGQDMPAFGDGNWEQPRQNGNPPRYESNQPYEGRGDGGGRDGSSRYDGGQPQRYDNRPRTDDGRNRADGRPRYDNNRPRYDDRRNDGNRGDGRQDNNRAESRPDNNRNDSRPDGARVDNRGRDDNRSRSEGQGIAYRAEDRAERPPGNGHRPPDDDRTSRPQTGGNSRSEERSERVQAPREPRAPRADKRSEPREGNGAEWAPAAVETALPAFITSPVPIAAAVILAEGEDVAAEPAPVRAPRRRRYTRRTEGETPAGESQAGDAPSEVPVD